MMWRAIQRFQADLTVVVTQMLQKYTDEPPNKRQQRVYNRVSQSVVRLEARRMCQGILRLS